MDGNRIKGAIKMKIDNQGYTKSLNLKGGFSVNMFKDTK